MPLHSSNGRGIKTLVKLFSNWSQYVEDVTIMLSFIFNKKWKISLLNKIVTLYMYVAKVITNWTTYRMPLIYFSTPLPSQTYFRLRYKKATYFPCIICVCCRHNFDEILEHSLSWNPKLKQVNYHHIFYLSNFGWLAGNQTRNPWISGPVFLQLGHVHSYQQGLHFKVNE